MSPIIAGCIKWWQCSPQSSATLHHRFGTARAKNLSGGCQLVILWRLQQAGSLRGRYRFHTTVIKPGASTKQSIRLQQGALQLHSLNTMLSLVWTKPAKLTPIWAPLSGSVRHRPQTRPSRHLHCLVQQSHSTRAFSVSAMAPLNRPNCIVHCLPHKSLDTFDAQPRRVKCPLMANGELALG